MVKKETDWAVMEESCENLRGCQEQAKTAALAPAEHTHNQTKWSLL